MTITASSSSASRSSVKQSGTVLFCLTTNSRQWVKQKRTVPNCLTNCLKHAILGDGALAVGLWNLFEDTAYSPRLGLNFTPKSVRGVNCTAAIDGDAVTLSDIPPFSFAAVEIAR